MPKKEKKTKEEKYAEEYFPLDEEDVKHAVEKPVKEKIATEEVVSVEDYEKKERDEEDVVVEKEYKRPEIEKVEKVGKKVRKKVKHKKTKKTKKSVLEKVYKIPNVKLKKNGYELVITEKPQAASKIAQALGKATQKTLNKVSYYEVDRDGQKIVVACAVGHLFTLKQDVAGSHVPIFDISWAPNYMVRKKDFTKRYYDLILKLAKGAGSVTVATDYDVEGEVIGLNVIRFICNQKDANRMKFSTLTNSELNNAYDSKLKHIDWGQAIAGETRHYLDWFYGINLSRALMNAIKTTGKFRIMSIGRVQGPALNMIVKKEKEIQAFESEPYFQVFITVDDGENKLKLKHNKDIFDKKELTNFDDLEGKEVDLKIDKKQQILPPNPPFNLTTLQTEAYKFYGITPANTLRVAQSLYLAGLISYPRTSSQKLPDSIDYKSILKKLAKEYNVENLIKKQKPIEGKKTDPAHPSIYPTGDTQILSGNDEKIYNLIAKRFLALFCEDAIIDNKKISTEINNLNFSIRGSTIAKKSWMEIYPSKLKEEMIPGMKDRAKIVKVEVEEKQTQPPKRYSQASIISQLEKKNLGTKATRSSILETLYDRGYVKDKNIEATPLGVSLIDTLEEYSPIIVDEKLTRSFEKEMEAITQAKKNQVEHQKKIIEKAKTTINKIANSFEKNEKSIGKALLRANVEQREQEKIENTLMKCPKCKKGNLVITYSKKTRRHFIACDAYPDCRNTFSLPPKGTIKKTDKVCEKCGFPMLMSVQYGKKPWFFCFNPLCETNKERIEEYNRKKAEKEGNKE